MFVKRCYSVVVFIVCFPECMKFWRGELFFINEWQGGKGGGVANNDYNWQKLKFYCILAFFELPFVVRRHLETGVDPNQTTSRSRFRLCNLTDTWPLMHPLQIGWGDKSYNFPAEELCHWFTIFSIPGLSQQSFLGKIFLFQMFLIISSFAIPSIYVIESK